jgi:hypothetical protein
MRKLIIVAVLALGAALLPAAALAATPNNPACWGAATRDLAQQYAGAMGEHASSFDSPRLGIGNVAQLFTGTHQPGDLAAALGFSCD